MTARQIMRYVVRVHRVAMENSVIWRSNYRWQGSVLPSEDIEAPNSDCLIALLARKHPESEILADSYFDPYVPWEKEFPGVISYQNWWQRKFNE